MRSIILLTTIAVLLSCNDQQQEEKPEITVTKTSPVNCYSYINNRDTVILKTISIGSSMTGTLVYNLYEKDRNKGTIQGEMKGDLLIADYTFFSEGTSSVRQVVFKKMDNSLVQGNGEVMDQNGKTIFKNIDSLNYNNSISLKEIDCEK